MSLFGRRAKPLEEMTDRELMDAWTAEGDLHAESKARLKAFSAEHNKRIVRDQAKRLLDTLSDDQRAALHQQMRVKSIESGEAFGG